MAGLGSPPKSLHTWANAWTKRTAPALDSTEDDEKVAVTAKHYIAGGLLLIVLGVFTYLLLTAAPPEPKPNPPAPAAAQ